MLTLEQVTDILYLTSEGRNIHSEVAEYIDIDRYFECCSHINEIAYMFGFENGVTHPNLSFDTYWDDDYENCCECCGPSITGETLYANWFSPDSETVLLKIETFVYNDFTYGNILVIANFIRLMKAMGLEYEGD